MDQETIQLVQEALNLVLFESMDVDGVVGPETTKFVKQFQEQRGIDADGIIGPDTIAELKDALDEFADDDDNDADEVERAEELLDLL